jgi:hypothetical protein
MPFLRYFILTLAILGLVALGLEHAIHGFSNLFIISKWSMVFLSGTVLFFELSKLIKETNELSRIIGSRNRLPS